MTADEARYAAIEFYERLGFIVYERRVKYGQPSVGQLVVVEPFGGSAWIVRVQVGKRPPRSKRVLTDRRRVGLADLLVVVDPRDGTVRPEQAASGREAA